MRKWLLSMLPAFRSLQGNTIKSTPAAKQRHLALPSLELLEDRTVPSTFSSIVSNFNGTAIPAGDTLWFTAVGKVNGLGSAPVTVDITDQVITFQAAGATYSVDVPNSEITFSPAVTTGTTSFDASQNAWVSSLPSNFPGNAFLGAVAFPVTSTLPGGINPVTWQGNFATDTAGVKLNWQWAAAVYTSFSSDYNALNVKPLDSNQATLYKNSDDAGTPEAFKSDVTGGARGGGGSNWTGSLSATASVAPAVENLSPPASISGYVFDAGTGLGLANLTVTLTGMTANGQNITLTATTNSSGFYQFTNLAPGNYMLSDSIASGYYPTAAVAGTVNGGMDGTNGTTQITSITLGSGNAGINYDFYQAMNVIAFA